jgi:hypothetical protein
MPSQSPHADTTRVLRNVRSLTNHQNQQKHTPLGDSELPPSMRRVPVRDGERDSSHEGSFVPSTIQGQNCTPSPSLNYSRVADITQHVTSTLSTTQRRSIITPTATPGTSSRNTPVPSRTILSDSTRCVVSIPASRIVCTPTPLNGLANMPTSIPNTEAHAIISNPL